MIPSIAQGIHLVPNMASNKIYSGSTKQIFHFARSVSRDSSMELEAKNEASVGQDGGHVSMASLSPFSLQFSASSMARRPDSANDTINRPIPNGFRWWKDLAEQLQSPRHSKPEPWDKPDERAWLPHCLGSFVFRFQGKQAYCISILQHLCPPNFYARR